MNSGASVCCRIHSAVANFNNGAFLTHDTDDPQFRNTGSARPLSCRARPESGAEPPCARSALYFGATPPLEGAWMKLHSFHLMPYSDLPEDFKQKYRSVWV